MTSLQSVLGETVAFVKEVQDVDLWVVNPKADVFDEKMQSQMIHMRNLPGVVSVAPFFRGSCVSGRGSYTLIGIDEESLLGLPKQINGEMKKRLFLKDSVLIDKPVKVGRMLQIGHKKVVVAGSFQNKHQASSEPLIYTTFRRAHELSTKEAREVPYVLIKTKEHANLSQLTKIIEAETKLKAYTKKELTKMLRAKQFQKNGLSNQFSWVVFFGFALALGIIGMALLSISDGIRKDLSIFKSIGASRFTLTLMSLYQAIFASTFSYIVALILYRVSLSFIPYRFNFQIASISFLSVIGLGVLVALINIPRVKYLPHGEL